MQTKLQNYFRWLIRHRLLVLAASAAVVTTALVSASRVRMDYTIEQFFPAFGRERRIYEEYKASFPKEDAQISLFWQDAQPLSAAVYRDMQRAARLFEEVGLEDVQWIGSVEVADIDVTGGEVGLRLRKLIEEEKLSDAYLREILAQHREDDLYRGYLWNSDQSVFAIHGVLNQPLTDDLRRREIEESLTDKLASLEREGRTLVLSGIPVIRSRIPKLLEADQRTLLVAGLLLFLAVLFLFFRHAGQVALCLASVFPAYLCTVGLIGALGKSITILTGFVPIIVLVVGGSDTVHLLTRYRQIRARAEDNAEAIVGSFSELASPCFYTSLTTAIGFFSLTGTRIGIVVDFGVFTAIAIFITYAFSMTLLPVALSFYTRKVFDSRGLEARWLGRIVEAAVRLTAKPSRRVVAVFALIAALGLGLGLTLRVNTFLVDDLKEDSQLIRDLRWIEDKGFGLFQVNVYLKETGEVPLHDPAALAWMRDFQRFVRAEPLVVNSFALTDFIGPLGHAAVGEDRYQELQMASADAVQKALVAELLDTDLFADVYHPEAGEAQVIVVVRDEGSSAMLPFIERVDRYLEDHPPPIGTAVSTGTVKLIQNYAAQILRSFGPSLLIAVVLILAVMSYMFRSVKHGLLALIPNLFPLLVLLGVMKVFGFDLKPSTILVFSIAFGIAVDDTIHFLGRFRAAVRQGVQLEVALAESLRETGRAILMTSLVVSAGFALLMASRFEVLFLVGFMTMVSALSAVAADLFVFPSIVAAAWGREPYSTAPLPVTSGPISLSSGS